MSELDFKINYSDIYSINKHLSQVSDFFIPPLHTYVDIQEYAKKIFQNATTFEMWDREKLIGIIAAYINNQTSICFITNISVLKDYQGVGVASKLMQELFVYLKEKNIMMIKLEVSKMNSEVIKFYLRMGFRYDTTNTDNNIMVLNFGYF